MGKEVSRKTRIILIACAAGFVAAAAAVLLGVLLTQLPTDGDNNPQVEYLPQSAKGELLVATKVGATRPNGDALIIARSYDGNVWEAMPDLDNEPPSIDCNDQGQCTMKVDGDYETSSVEVPPQLKELSPMHLAARLHMQATFGATKDELLQVASSYGDNYGLWVLDQMRLAPTLARSYYRQRANARPGDYEMGRGTQPCDIGSRWHSYVFNARDKYLPIQITLNTAASRFVIRVNGAVRGETSTLFGKSYAVASTIYTFPFNLRICTLNEGVGGAMMLTNSSVCNLFPWTNPAIDFISPSAIQTFGPNDALLDPVVGAGGYAVILKNRQVPCSGASDGKGNYYIRQGNTTYLFDARIRFMRNTVETPSNVEASYSGQCPVVAKSYENRGQCVRRAACSGSSSFKSANFVLNDSILRSWYTKSTRYVYYITGLRLDDPFNISPCSSGISRWQRLGKGTCPAPTTLDATTKNTFVTALSTSTDANPYVRDISLTGANCSPTAATIGAQVEAAGECFQHVHPDLFSVRDFTRWVDVHDGNKDAMAGGNPNPIAKWAQQDSTNLPFPNTHPMTRFYDRRGYIPIVGRYGDTINFQDLSTDLQTEEVAAIVGALRVNAAGESFIACGSYGETENVPDLGHHYNVWNYNASGFSTAFMEWPIPQKTDHLMVLENVALKATDQLRQRIAWSLLNIVTIASQDIDFQEYIESWLTYYDILVRNAFGNYMDILRDVSYHPMMGQYLSYYQNKAYSVQGNYPDENYAREIMQLFSIGLWRLNDDGTQKLDADGIPIETYTNEDITDYARLWTGFDRQAIRSNLATIFAFGATPNHVDKMQIRPQWRDRFPKAKLDSGYIGDTYPLCDDMPAQSFLREGARYEYTGTFSVEGDFIDSENATKGPGIRGRFAPPTTSSLYQALCAPATAGGACTFPLTVTLTSNLPCTGNQECNAQRVLTVKVVDPVAKIARHYAYVGLPCVRLTLFNNGQLVKRDSSRGQCADPTTRVGGPICCNAVGVVSNYTSECLFSNEVTDFATTKQRCASMGLDVCPASKFKAGVNWATSCADMIYAWTNTSCSVQVQVYSSGLVGIVDPVSFMFNILKPSSNNVFRVRWANDVYPVANNGICPDGCSVQATPDGAGSCLCNYTMSSTPVFGQLSDLNGISADDAVNALAQQVFVGSIKPSNYDDGTYSVCSSSECTRLSNVVVWVHKDDNGGLSEKTIFQLPPVRLGGRVRYLLNKIPTISVSDSFSFRNPPHFTPLLGELQEAPLDWTSDNLWVRKAEYEVEALLEHLFEHDNTAVFISYRLIQQLITSNPSPRFVKSVVNAFRTGAYGDVRFSGKYGDLGATVYAILMDHEARSPIVEADHTYGMLRDPLLKVYHFMRSLGYASPKGREVALNWDLDQIIGVQPFTAPTVFGFYLPEYRPQGPVGDAGLVGPQVQIATTPALVGYLNGITSLVDNGLTSCDGGLAIFQTYGTRTCNANGPHPSADGALTYTPNDGASAEDIVDELDMILTAGRLNPQTRANFLREYNNIRTNDTMAPQALRHLLKLFGISSEYQTTNFNALTTETRTVANAVEPQGRRFRAVVVIFEYGGCDSFSLLVPHSNCPAKDLYNEYRTVRTEAALDKADLLPIAVPKGTQPCDTFGVHPAMKNVQALYNEGSALFTANIGSLVEPATKDQINKRQVRVPPSLFAHNIMTRNVQNVFAQYLAADGVLGRMTDALLVNNPPYSSALFSLGGNVKMVQGKLVPADYLSGSAGVVRVRGLNKIANALGNITQFTSDSVFADTYADTMSYSVGKTEVLGSLIANTNLTTTFGKSYIDVQLQQVAKLIKSMPDATGVERAMFFTSVGGFDTHPTFDLNPLLGPVDTAVGTFAAEMKAQGKWDDVVILTVSEFGRTLTSNGKGTDHAWGGNHFVAGGSIKGGQILGHYPDVLTDDGPQILTRGRVVPTMPFEGMWKGIAEWMGVPADQMEKVLPNVNDFPADVMYSKEKMFKKL